MKDERNRLGKGFAVAIVAHVIFALLLGVFGLTFNSNRPPEILEVSTLKYSFSILFIVSSRHSANSLELLYL